MAEQFDRYCHVVTDPPHKSLRLIADLVESEPSATPYNLLPQKLKILCQTLFNLDFSMCLGMERTFSYLCVATIMDTARVLHERHTLYSCVQQICFGLAKLNEKTALQTYILFINHHEVNNSTQLNFIKPNRQRNANNSAC
jgi:hypothetical protein